MLWKGGCVLRGGWRLCRVVRAGSGCVCLDAGGGCGRATVGGWMGRGGSLVDGQRVGERRRGRARRACEP